MDPGGVRQGHFAISQVRRGPLDVKDGVMFYYVLRCTQEGG